MRHLCLLFSLATATVLGQNRPVKVYLKTGEVVSTRYARLDNDSPEDSFVVLHDDEGEKVFINHIDSIQASGDGGESRIYKPLTSYRGLIWGERTYRSGNITIYYTDVGMAGSKVKYKPRHFQYTKNDGELRYLTRGNLYEDLSDSETSMNHVRKGHSIGKKQAMLWATGGALMLGSLVYEASSFDAVDGNVPITLFAGMAIFVTPWFLNPSRYRHYLEAVKAYRPSNEN